MVTGCWEVFDRDGGQKRVAKAKKGVVRLLWPLSAATITAINVKWKLDSGNRNDLGNQIGAADTALSFRIVVHTNYINYMYKMLSTWVRVLFVESEKERVAMQKRIKRRPQCPPPPARPPSPSPAPLPLEGWQRCWLSLTRSFCLQGTTPSFLGRGRKCLI